jgi:dCMP deaminase
MNELVEKDKAIKYFKLAKYNAYLFSKDPDTKVGSIILSEDFSRILSTGINGFPRKMNDDDVERWEKPMKYIYCSHAESNSISNCARTGTSTDNSIMITTKFPCTNCTKLIIQAGIKKIYSAPPEYSSPMWGDDARISEKMLNEVGINIILI